LLGVGKDIALKRLTADSIGKRTPVPLFLRALEIDHSRPFVALALAICSGSVRTNDVGPSVIFGNGPLEIANTLAGSVVICDGDVNAHTISGSLVIARGTVSAVHILNSTVQSGELIVRESITGSALTSRKQVRRPSTG